MRLQLLKSKLHRATVTQADLDYEGSLTLDEDLMKAAEILEHELVHVWNVTSGTRLVTYAIRGERGSGVVCINGAAAHLVRAGDLVIIATYCELEPDEARHHQPRVVLLGEGNHIKQVVGREVPGPARRGAPTPSPSAAE